MIRTTFALTLALVMLPAAIAQNHGGGARATNNKYVLFDLESWVPGAKTNLTFTDAPATTTRYILVISTALNSANIPGFRGTLKLDISGGKGFWLYGAKSTPVTLPASLAGVKAYIQGAVVDQNGLGYFTDATEIDFFKPKVLAGCSRQSANSILSIDLGTRKIVQKLGNSELGNITFSRDRKWAYVTEPGSRRNYITPYDISGKTIVARPTIRVSGGIRYRCAASRDGLFLYVPIHNGISVIDTSTPGSPTWHKELRVMKTPITGNSGTIFTGPMSCALDITETKLYIAYGENLTFPAQSTVGVIDLAKSNYPHRVIKVTTGGSFFGLATRMDIVRSPDGVHVYTVEWGVQPTLPFVVGFKNGGILNIINTLTDKEVKAIPTAGYGAQELTADRAGRSVWIPQISSTNAGQLLRVDVDPRSANMFKIRSTITVGSGYSAGSSGPMGVDCTPDSSIVCFTMGDGRGQRFPEMWTLNARTEKVFGSAIRVESLPGTLSITQW